MPGLGGRRVGLWASCLLLAAPAAAAGSERPVSFLYDVLPVLSRVGCNQGTCHGNSEGRGGLKLSLRGEAPEADYAVLARAGGGRRLDRRDPGRSLLLLKGTSSLPHGGGVRLAPGSQEYGVVARWVAEGAAMDGPDAPRVVSLEVLPRERILAAPARELPLRALARFSDGSRRDVSRLSFYSPGDPRVEVSPNGLVRGTPGLDTAVLVRYAGEMAASRVTFIAAGSKKPAASYPAPVNWVDRLQFARLRELGLTPSAPATDTEFVRRAYLDTTGLLPTAEEVRRFHADGRPDRRGRLVEELLERPEFDEFWTLKWSDLLRVEERTLDPRGSLAYRDWIRTSLATRKPMNRFAAELLTATGSTY
ncbi:MAG: DUF1549 domain-containing protein, partial [Armatimonadetes bacterium]|nr:DUF1549 domain-containing protein [Armatimonadota bacterium]